MGMRGIVGATVRGSMREAKKELKRQEKEYQKALEREKAYNKVEKHEKYRKELISVHKECSKPIDWEAIANLPIPKEPTHTSLIEDKAKEVYNNYRSGFFDRIFKREEKKRSKLKEAILEGHAFKDKDARHDRLRGEVSLEIGFIYGDIF
jgi:hypothetical protein